MAHKSAYADVLAGQIPVNPKGSQPPYFRSKKTVATSARLHSFRACIAEEMKGKKGSRKSIREAFAEAAKKC